MSIDHSRRAATLMIHHGRRDEAGINDVIAQVRGDDQPDSTTELVLALLRLFEALAPVIYTEPGLRLLSQAVVDLAAEEGPR